MMTNSTLSRASIARPGAALVIALALLTTLAAPSSTAQAQDVQVEGPLAGQPAVRHMRLYREGRLRLMPTFGMTLQNEFTRALLAGAEVSYGLTDWLSIGVWGAYSVVQVETRASRTRSAPAASPRTATASACPRVRASTTRSATSTGSPRSS
jgi:hypothetical protein